MGEIIFAVAIGAILVLTGIIMLYSLSRESAQIEQHDEQES